EGARGQVVATLAALLAAEPTRGIFDANSDAMIPEARCSCGSPMPRGERIANPAERATRLAGSFCWRPSKGARPCNAVVPEGLCVDGAVDPVGTAPDLVAELP